MISLSWPKSWWRHQMGTFSALLALCEGNPQVYGGFSSQRPMTWSFDTLFDLRLNKRLSKHSRRRGFETPLRPLWRHCKIMGPTFWHTVQNPPACYSQASHTHTHTHTPKITWLSSHVFLYKIVYLMENLLNIRACITAHAWQSPDGGAHTAKLSEISTVKPLV